MGRACIKHKVSIVLEKLAHCAGSFATMLAATPFRPPFDRGGLCRIGVEADFIAGNIRRRRRSGGIGTQPDRVAYRGGKDRRRRWSSGRCVTAGRKEGGKTEGCCPPERDLRDPIENGLDLAACDRTNERTNERAARQEDGRHETNEQQQRKASGKTLARSQRGTRS